MNKKYELFGEPNEQGLRRIRALRSFGNIKAGDVGGWLEGEHNLSHGGDCWVSGEARVWGRALVRDNAEVYGHAMVYGYALVCEHSVVCGYAKVCWYTTVCGNARVGGSASVVGGDLCGKAKLEEGSPVALSGLKWNVTITPKYMTIGCQSHSISFWRRASKKRIAAMAVVGSTEFWSAYRDTLLQLHDAAFGEE